MHIPTWLFWFLLFGSCYGALLHGSGRRPYVRPVKVTTARRAPTGKHHAGAPVVEPARNVPFPALFRYEDANRDDAVDAPPLPPERTWDQITDQTQVLPPSLDMTARPVR